MAVIEVERAALRPRFAVLAHPVRSEAISPEDKGNRLAAVCAQCDWRAVIGAHQNTHPILIDTAQPLQNATDHKSIEVFYRLFLRGGIANVPSFVWGFDVDVNEICLI